MRYEKDEVMVMMEERVVEKVSKRPDIYILSITS